MFDEQNPNDYGYHSDDRYYPEQIPEPVQQPQPDYNYHPNSEWEQKHCPMPPAQPESNGFVTAALVMGILSLVFLFSGLSPFFGGLGILFAVLSRKGQGKLQTQTRVGLGLSIGGFVLGISIWIGLFFLIPNLVNDPSFQEEFLRQYNAYYNGNYPDESDDSHDSEYNGNYNGDHDEYNDGYYDEYNDYYDGYYDEYDDYYDEYNDYYGGYRDEYNDYFGDYYNEYNDDYRDGYGNGFDGEYNNGDSYNPFQRLPGNGASGNNSPDTMNYGGLT